MIVKIEWTDHGRKYTIGIRQFLLAAGVNLSESEIQKAVVKLLNKNEFKQINE